MCKKITLTSLLTIALSFSLIAQEQIAPDKHLHKDQQERVFVKATQGVYFFISDSPDPSTAVQMKSHKFEEKTSPMYFDGHGIHYMKHEDLYDSKDIVFEVYADKIAPASKISFSVLPAYTEGNHLVFNQPFEVIQQATDHMSGVQQMYASIDGESFETFEQGKNFDKEQTYIYTYYAVDNVGNVEAAKTLRLSLDMSLPVSTLTPEGDRKDAVYSGNAKLLLSANDKGTNIKTIHYQIDDGPEKTYAHPILTRYLSEGSHKIRFYAVDQVGNKEKPQEYAFFVDKTAPFINTEVLGDNFISGNKKYSSGRTKMKITAFDNKAGVQAIYYAINEEEYQLYEKPFYLPSDKKNIVVKAYAVDDVNNKGRNDVKKSQASDDGMVILDLNGPKLDYSLKGPTFNMRDTVYVNHTTQVALQAKDLESGLKKLTYRVNGGETQVYEKPFSLTKEGHYTIEMEGFDNVNNLNRSVFHLTVDNTGPKIFSTPSIKPLELRKAMNEAKSKIYAPHISIFLSATDEKVGNEQIYYSVNGEKSRQYTQAISGFNAGSSYILEIKAVDKLGNESKEEVTFFVE